MSLHEATATRLASASAGSILTSLLVTPLDVVKTRMQQTPRFPGAGASPLPNHSAPAAPTASASASSSCANIKCPIGRTPPALAATKSATNIMTSCREVFFSGGREVVWFCTHPAGWNHNAHVHATPSGRRVAYHPRSALHVPSRFHGQLVSAPSSLNAVVPVAAPLADAAATGGYSGTWDAMAKIARAEGIASLWRGLTPTLAMALPANVIYFVGYESLKDGLVSVLPSSSPDTIAPLLSGAFARTIAVTVISPIELVRTQMQSATAVDKSFTDILRQVSVNVRRSGSGYLWRGLSATLARDVPFSALYWATYESIKPPLTRMLESSTAVPPPPPLLVHSNALPTSATTHGSNVAPFAAGALAGMLAATVTTPLDVVKTRRQLGTHGTPRRIVAILRSIARHEGIAGLFSGLVPRVAKVAPACAIMIGTYEYGKSLLGGGSESL